MSLKTRFGNLGNILNFDNLTKENIYVLDGPILSNSQFEKFLNYFGENYKLLDCTFCLVDNLEDALSKKTKAVMLAHTLGNPLNLKAVTKLCKEKD